MHAQTDPANRASLAEHISGPLFEHTAGQRILETTRRISRSCPVCSKLRVKCGAASSGVPRFGNVVGQLLDWMPPPHR